MRLFCRDDHDEPEDRCPPHAFHGALWDDVATNTTLSVIYCEMCGDIRQLEPPSLSVPDLETISAETDAE
jgi:hypothetical protein